MERNDKLIETALHCGAAKAVVIPISSVVLSDTFFDICKSNACGYFGRCWMCPPDIGPIHELMERVRACSGGLLYQTIGTLEDSFDIEGMSAAARIHARVSQRIDAAIKPLLDCGIFHLSCGGCNLCDACSKRTNEPCRFPDKALMSMEGVGINVYNTVKDTPLKYINGQNTVTYFGLALFEEDKNA